MTTMPKPGHTSTPNCSSGNALSNATTICAPASSEGSGSSPSQQLNGNDVEKRPNTPYGKLSPKTLNSWRLRVLESLNMQNVGGDGDEEDYNHTPTSVDKADAPNPFDSPVGSEFDILNMSLSSIVSKTSRVASNEMCQTIKALRPLSQELEDVILPEQCAAIEKHVKKGRHLVALAQAIRFSCDFAFEGNYRDSFMAGIHIYRIGEEDEAPGIELQFKKQLSLDLRKYIARQLLRGLLLRYPKRSFPRTFWVAEGDTNPAEKRAILLTNDVVGTDSVYELDRKNHNILVKQWWDDCLDGSKVARVK
ncbi:hypothetical protein EV127DRAFT_414729 [Xylaria flabelliformis]|nr:hypothetical protein EV127DRAFT_414729 [Xylaria flabelliformis]